MTETVAAFTELRAELVLSFTEGTELPEHAVSDLQKHVSKRNMAVLSLPISAKKARQSATPVWQEVSEPKTPPLMAASSPFY